MISCHAKRSCGHSNTKGGNHGDNQSDNGGATDQPISHLDMPGE
jgi:hypothetical protein